MKRDRMLFVLRNPYLVSKEEAREAKLKAADLIEQLEKVNLEWCNFASDNNIPLAKSQINRHNNL